ncbi:7418_t:CDS:2, partial [Acaulospora morrowiae]
YSLPYKVSPEMSIHPLFLPEILEQVKWCRSAIPLLWEKPFEADLKKCIKVVSLLVAILESNNSKTISRKKHQSNCKYSMTYDSTNNLRKVKTILRSTKNSSMSSHHNP